MREAWRTRSGTEREEDGAEGILTMLVCVCLVERKSKIESLSI